MTGRGVTGRGGDGQGPVAMEDLVGAGHSPGHPVFAADCHLHVQRRDRSLRGHVSLWRSRCR